MQADRTPDDLLELRELRTSFFTDAGEVKAVDGVSLTVRRGRTTCIVGESGSGKSATARSILQLVDTPGRIVDGEILLHPASGGEPIDLASLDPHGASLRGIRGKDIGMIFQEPMSSLSPVHTIGNQIAEVLFVHEGRHAKDVRKRVIAELDLVGIPQPAERFDSYTFQLSGGMRQRAMIAMALITRPQLLIADEPTTALDVTTQAQILDLLRERKDSSGMSLLFITHDLGVVAEIADDVVVMRHGKIVETGTVDEIFHAPQHPYTRSLLASLPQRGVETLHRVPVVSAARDAGQPVLEVDALTMEFHTRSGKRFSGKTKSTLVAVDDVSLSVYPGQTLGLVGESGCGKTTLGRTILRAYKPTSGRLLYRAEGADVVDLAPLSQRALLPYRRDIRMVFQDPYGSLNPQMTVQQIVTEPLRAAGVRGTELHDRAAAMMTRVGLRTDYLARYPHAFSGGERQRIGIARALITSPKLVVADEAVSALDVSIRTQVLELLAQLQAELGLTYIFISHDLSVIERICDEVVVMYFGRIVETGSASDVFLNPQHGYTQSLLSAVPIADPAERGMRHRFSYRPDDAIEADRLTA